MQFGTLASLTPMGWYGFIVDADGREVFFHSSALEGAEFEELAEGDAVTFDTVDDQYGLRATLVRRSAEVHSPMLLEELLCAV
ncbi:MAG: cold shock domain-containing protein [Planctomycetes bacterium]|nr:cold shock domain-containing protein [Planctomycetota bacterium]